MLSKATILFVIAIVQLVNTRAQQVHYKGSMSRIKQEQKIDAAVLVDTLPQDHLYAIGPVENFRGEIFVWDGKPFVAAMTDDYQQPMVYKNVRPLRAIFLVYAQVPAWDTILLNAAPASMQQLERLISQQAAIAGIDTSTAFPFLLYGKVQKGNGHIMYKDTAQKVLTPEVQQAANHSYAFANIQSQFLGFYSQHHKGIFTHHDSYLHIHFRLNTKFQAGHLDAVAFDPDTPLYLFLPKQK